MSKKATLLTLQDDEETKRCIPDPDARKTAIRQTYEIEIIRRGKHYMTPEQFAVFLNTGASTYFEYDEDTEQIVNGVMECVYKPVKNS